MGAGPELILSLTEAAARTDAEVGGKARGLARLMSAGYRVPAGFCVGVAAYERFVASNDLPAMIGMELGRKPLDTMRWEELWDAALRIRAAFLAAPLPRDLADAEDESRLQREQPGRQLQRHAQRQVPQRHLQ